jgi:hypothetical protein
MKDEDYAELLASDAGNPAFAEYAASLSARGRGAEGLVVCLRGLSHNPGFHRGRLVLARILQELGFLPFAVREVECLCEELPHNKSLKKLLNKLDPSRGLEKKECPASAVTMAEVEMSFEDLEVIDEEEK